MSDVEIIESDKVDGATIKTPIILDARFIIKVLQEDKAAVCTFYELWANNEPLGTTALDAQEVLKWTSNSIKRDEYLINAKEMLAQLTVFPIFDLNTHAIKRRQ